jgi:glycosyltransferase involved in cell wall biosynthesis
MTPLLAILIPFTPDRQLLHDRVSKQIEDQIGGHPVEIISYKTESNKNGGPTTGAKRNRLLELARENNASHIAFVDSDDLVSPRYIEAVMPGVYGDYDCCELWGQYYVLEKPGMPFHHSIQHDHWWQDNKAYYRNPNHLSVIKLAHLHDIRFQDKTVGEDGHYSIDIQKTGRLKKEYPVKEIIYHYFDGDKTKKNHALEPMITQRRGTKL